MIGKTVSHYQILEKISEGGMGIVYKARDASLNRCVALKFLPPHLTQDETTRKRFIFEAQAASALDHPNICIIHEINETEDGRLYICMAHYKGESLRQKIKKGPIPIDRAVNTFLQIAGGLKAAHDKKIIHRDIKPGNILITDKGEVKIVDFGLAKLAGEKITESVSTKGTIAYMAPELIQGLPGDHRTDIWSLGVLFYEMLTGHLPFKGDYPEPMMYAIVNKEPESLSYYLKDVPELLQRIINKIFKKIPQERYQTLAELLQDFKPLSREAVLQREANSYHFITRAFRKKSVRYITLTTAVLLLTFIFIILFKPAIFKEILHIDPPLIALISFENQTGDDAYDVWEKGIPNLLITKLEQLGGLRVTSWERLHDLKKQLGKDDVDFIDLDLGIQLCQMEGVEMIVTGTLLKAGETFATDVKVLDVDSKKIIKSASAQGDDEGSILQSQVDHLSREITRGLGFTEKMMAALQKPVRDITTTSSEAYKYYIRGRELNAKWRFSEAKPFYELAVQHDSTFAPAHYLLGELYEVLGLYKKSEEAFAKAMKYLEHASDQESLGWKWDYYLYRNIDKSDSLLKVYIEKYGIDENAHYRAGCIHKIRGEYDQAIEEFNKALTLNPDRPKLYNQIGSCYLSQDNYEQALESYRKYASLAPGDANVYDCLGNVYMKVGNVESMITAFKEVYRIDPQNPWATQRLALSYAWKEDYDEAIKWSLSNKNEYRLDLPLYNKGIYNYLSGRIQQALIDLDMAIQVADSIYHAGEWPGTLRNAPYLKAWIYYDLYQFERGRVELKRKLKYSVATDEIDWIDILRNYKFDAMSSIRSGQLESAKQYQNLINLMYRDTTYSVGQRNVILFWHDLIKTEILLEENSADLALNLATKINFNDLSLFARERVALSLFPFQYDLTARAFIKLGKVDDAIAEYERLTSDNPKNRGWHIIPARYHYILAQLYEQKGWPGKAIDKYKHFLKVWQDADPDIPELIDARKRLSSLKM